MIRQAITRRSLTIGMATVAGWFVSAKAAANDQDSDASRKAIGGGISKVPAEDRLALLELMALYAWGYDTEDAELLASTFTPQGKLVVFGNVLVEGGGGFPSFIERARAMKGDHGWQHLANHHVFSDYDGKSCKIYSYYTMAESDLQGGNLNMRAMGYYASNCARSENGWLFAERSIVRWNGKAPFKR